MGYVRMSVVASAILIHYNIVKYVYIQTSEIHFEATD